MADDDRDPTVKGERTAEPAAPSSRRAAAQAASRARRIGGSRPTPGGRPRPGPGPSETDTPDGGPSDNGSAVDAGDTDPDATARPAIRTRVAGRRPTPGPRETDDDGDDAPTRTTTKTATRSGTRGSGGRAVQPPPATSAKPSWLRWLPAGVAAALVVALAIVDVVMLQNWRDQPGKAERRQQLIASVNVAVAKILSYDYRHLDQDEAAASGRLTGKFRDDYVHSMDSTIKTKAPSEKAVVVGEISSAAISSVSGDGKQAVLLVLGQQTITNTKQTTPRNEIVSLRVTAQLVHGKWLVSDLASL
jgi:Mce-associated membrane protein